MIEIPQPALALNSADFGPSDHYRMQYSTVVPRSWTVQQIADSVGATLTASGGNLAALVINAHGMAGPDGVALGTGLHIGSLAPLLMFRGAIGRIYLCACQRVGWVREATRRFCPVPQRWVVAALRTHSTFLFER